MAEPQTSRFWIAAQQSGLLDSQGLRACWDAIPPEKRDAVEHLDRRLARQAVQQSLLTLWQAQQLLAGRTSGFRVDRYLLLELIGQGGMGRVYLARDTRLNRLVALKILAPERMNNSRAVERFKREARVGAQLQHENLVRIYDFGQANGRFFLVMEYIEGKTIGALITTQGPMPAPTAARLTWQIALGLEHAHRKGLIHRDVNPYNILVTHEGIAKLADLGLAIDLADDERVTREGATVGTFDYVAPEQARHSHAADIRSDIYSLGCTLYHMVAGQVPFPSPSLPEKLFAHQALEPTPLNQLIPHIPPDFVDIVQRMMRKQPEERYATPLQVAQALEPFIDEYPRIRDGEPAPIPLIMDEPAAQQIVSAPASGEVQPASSVPALQQVPQVANGPGRESLSSPTNLEPGGGRPALAVPSFLTPVNDSPLNSSTEDVPLSLDLGPEPSLTDSLSRPKSWFGPEKPVRPSAPAKPSFQQQIAIASRLHRLFSQQGNPRVWWLATAAVVLALLAVGFAFARWLGNPPKPLESRNSARAGKQAATSRSRKTHLPGDTPRADGKGIHDQGKDEPAITVISGDGEEKPVEDFYHAMEAAVGANGWVVLHSRKPLSLTREQPPNLSGKGWLKLRAAHGVVPVLSVELKGQKPFLVIGPSMSLTLEGLTIEARYPEPSPGSPSPASVPIILTGGPALIRHCAFSVANGTQVSTAHALVADGSNLTVENCWFKGFQTALEVHAVGGSTTRVKQTMIVPVNRSLGDSGTAWGIGMQFMGGDLRGSARRLVLDHCTVTGTGLLQLAGFSSQHPLQVEASGCAVQTGALIGWQTSTAEWLPNSLPLQWKGKGNQLDITGAAWIVSADKGRLKPELQAIDRNGWQRIAQEEEPITGTIQFSSKPDASPESLAPSDYKIEKSEPGKVGINPEQVGPSADRR